MRSWAQIEAKEAMAEGFVWGKDRIAWDAFSLSTSGQWKPINSIFGFTVGEWLKGPYVIRFLKKYIASDNDAVWDKLKGKEIAHFAALVNLLFKDSDIEWNDLRLWKLSDFFRTGVASLVINQTNVFQRDRIIIHPTFPIAAINERRQGEPEN